MVMMNMFLPQGHCVFGSFTIEETINNLRQIAIKELYATQHQRACKRCGRLCHTELRCYSRFSITGEELPPVENILKFTANDIYSWINYERSRYFQKEATRDKSCNAIDLDLEMELRKCYAITDNLLYDHAEKCTSNQF